MPLAHGMDTLAAIPSHTLTSAAPRQAHPFGVGCRGRYPFVCGVGKMPVGKVSWAGDGKASQVG